MATLSRDDVLKLATLCRLRLTDDEIERYASELSEILQYVQQLSAVDVSNVRSTYQVTGLRNVMRTDDVYDYGYKTEDLLKNAPALKDNQFKVRRVL